jgi:hypothetical protein
MSYDMSVDGDDKSDVDRFTNKDLNFSIAWHSSVHSFYQQYMQKRLAVMKELKEASGHE